MIKWLKSLLQLLKMEGSVAMETVAVVVSSLTVGQRGARLLRLQVLVQDLLIGRVAGQRSQQMF